MHLLARLPRGTGDLKLVSRLKEAGIEPSPLSICGVERPYAPGLVLGFTNVEASKAAGAARRLAEILKAA